MRDALLFDCIQKALLVQILHLPYREGINMLFKATVGCEGYTARALPFSSIEQLPVSTALRRVSFYSVSME
jgi:hypothetical protein